MTACSQSESGADIPAASVAMRIDEIDPLFRRMERLSSALAVRSGVGTEWTYTFPDGETHTYRIKNVRPPEDIEDDVAHLLIWVWSVKDYLKAFAQAGGKKPRL